MISRIIRLAKPTLVLALITCVLPDFAAAEEFCSSPRFRKAFLEGQDAVDWPSVGPSLKKLGDSAVPCLNSIARGGAAGFGISECRVNPRKCPGWAILSLSAIGTPKAKGVLLELLGSTNDPVALTEVMGGVTFLLMREAIPGLRILLKHESPYVRTHAVLDLGALGSHSDFGAMVAITRHLPWDQMNPAIRGLELLGDPRTVRVLEELKAKFSEPSLRAEIQRSIDRFKAGKRIQLNPGP